MLQLTPNVDLSSVLSLENIRQALIRQEDTIIFALIERAQFARNMPVYQPDAIPVPGYAQNGQRYSLLEYLLRETEQMHGKIRRYTSPDEHPFYPSDLPPLVLPPLQYAEVLAPGAKAINLNDRIVQVYLDKIMPGITQTSDDNNYGSTAMHDVLCLPALSKRIHYGKFVAESKFRSNRAEYTTLIQQRDKDAIMALLTDRAVEKKVTDRVRRKAATYGQDDLNSQQQHDGNGSTRHYKVQPDTVAELYDQFVMPLTKQVQVMYLLSRLDHER
jgi:chorismate mutase